jgi:predicted N-acetyltransferase YhbS
MREGHLVKSLRDGNAVTLPLVALENGQLAAHIAFSPVQIDGASQGWHGLGPVAVRPELQRKGIGSALINAGLERLRKLGSHGCVLLGAPEFYLSDNYRRGLGDASLRTATKYLNSDFIFCYKLYKKPTDKFLQRLFCRVAGARLCSAPRNAIGLAGGGPVVGIDWLPT